MTLEADILRYSKSSKTGLFNLILYSPEPCYEEHLQQFAKTVLARFPCRLIFIRCQSGIHEIQLKGETSSVSEYLVIEVPSEKLFQVHYLIFPLLIPDVPLYLYWAQNPTSDKEIFPLLFPYASRTIFASERIESLPHFCHKLLELKHDVQKIDLIDSSWLFTLGWRQIFAQVFDNESKFEHLQQCKSLKIYYQGPNAIQSLYLLSWVAVRCSWHFKSCKKHEEEMILQFEHLSGLLEIQLVSQKQNQCAPGFITGLYVHGHNDHMYDISPFPNNIKERIGKVIVHISTPETCDLPFTLPLPSLKQNFPYLKELFYSPLDLHYFQILEMLSKISAGLS